MPGKIKILIVDDYDDTRELIKELLSRRNFLALEADTVQKARKIMKNHSDIQAIIFDGYMNQERTIDTIGLIIEIARKGFLGYMIATSSYPKMRENQKIAGCNEECPYKPIPLDLVNFVQDLSFPRPS